MEHSTHLFYLLDHRHNYYHLGKIIDVDQLYDEIDGSLDELFGGLELEVDPILVSKTLALVEKL
jgi:hypothetical protein